MRRKLTMILVILMAAAIVLAFAVPWLVNAERLRPAVEARLSGALARPVQIGKLGFSWLAGGISAEDIRVAEDPAFGTEPFLTAKALDVNVELLPLVLHRDLRIDSLKVREPRLRLQKKNGRWNTASLGQTAPARAQATGPQSSRPLPSGDAASSSPLVLKKLSIVGAQFQIEAAGSSLSQTYTDVNLEATHVTPMSPFPFTATANIPGDGKLKAEGTVGPNGEAGLPIEAALKLEHIDLGRSGYFGRDSGIAGTAELQATLRSDGRTANVAGSSTVEKLRLLKDASTINHPVKLDFSADYDLKSDAGRLSRGDLHLGKGTVRLTGGFDARNSPPVLNLTLATQGFPMAELQDLLPALGAALPAGASLQNGVASATLAASGAADRLIITGPVKLADVVIAGFDLGANLKAVAALAGINTGRDTRVQLLESRLRVAPEGIHLSDINAVIAGMGALTGAGTIAADHRLDFQMIAHLSKRGGLLGGILQQTGLGQLSTVPFRINGTTAKPVFVPDVNAILPAQKRPAGSSEQPRKNPLGGILNQLFNRQR